MRTTMDIDQTSYRLAKAIAAQTGTSLGRVVAEAIVAYYGGQGEPSAEVGRSEAGFPTLTIGRPITVADVSELEDE